MVPGLFYSALSLVHDLAQAQIKRQEVGPSFLLHQLQQRLVNST